MKPPIDNDLWLYKTIRIIKGFKGLRGKIQSIIKYLLSHTVDEKYFIPFMWVGRLSYNVSSQFNLKMLAVYKKRCGN